MECNLTLLCLAGWAKWSGIRNISETRQKSNKKNTAGRLRVANRPPGLLWPAGIVVGLDPPVWVQAVDAGALREGLSLKNHCRFVLSFYQEGSCFFAASRVPTDPSLKSMLFMKAEMNTKSVPSCHLFFIFLRGVEDMCKAWYFLGFLKLTWSFLHKRRSCSLLQSWPDQSKLECCRLPLWRPERKKEQHKKGLKSN